MNHHSFIRIIRNFVSLFRKHKLSILLKFSGLWQAGFYAFRHFNVAMLYALRVPLKGIQERIGRAANGSFSLDVCGGKPEWDRNLEAASAVGAELEKAVAEAEKKMQDEAGAGLNDGLTSIRTKGLEGCISQAI